MGLFDLLRYRLLCLRARRSAVDHPPGTGKAPGSNPGESTHLLSLASLAPVVRGLADPRERLRRSLSPERRHGVSRPSRRLRRRSVPASPSERPSFTREREWSSPDLNPWKSQPGSAASRDATEGSVLTVERRSRETSEHPGMTSSGSKFQPARSAGRPSQTPLASLGPEKHQASLDRSASGSEA